MLSSISGQNERWAQLGAYQPPPPSKSDQDGGWGSTTGATASPGATPSIPTAGGVSPTLSDGMSFALIAFSGAAPAQSFQAGGQSNATSNPTSATPSSTSLGSQLLSDMQSLLSALTGMGASTNAGTPAGMGSSGTASTSNGSIITGSISTGSIGAASTPPSSSAIGAANGLSNTVIQDLQAVASDLNSIASAVGTGQPPGGASAGPPPWANNRSGSGTNATDDDSDRGNAGYNDGYHKQAGLAAYSAANTLSGLNSSATSSLTSITV